MAASRPKLRALQRALTCLLAALALGCSSLPPPAEAPPTQLRVAGEDSPLARAVAAADLPPGQSGFRSIPLSGVALQSRLALIAQAQVSLDIQSFQLGDDTTGHQLLRALRDAAARGVRVRLLLDDFHTTGMDALLLAAAAQPGMELRLYNPFGSGRDSTAGRWLVLALDFDRLNHRMHNKLFVADGRVAIVGGRNLADEYFRRSGEANFFDFDLLCAGPVVAELGHHFDLFWNSPLAYPVQALADDGRAPAQRRAAFDTLTAPPSTAALPAPMTPPAGALQQVQQLYAGRLGLLPAEAAVSFDSPDKTLGGPPPPTLPIASQFGRARQQVLLVSPYFVPSDAGLQRMRAAHELGVDIQVITNAVADSDQPLVGMAYAARLAQMLRAGVRLFELSSVQLKRDPRLRDSLGEGLGRLHMKLALIDERTLVVGSFNLDPRSAGTNTEMAVLVRSSALAQQVLAELAVLRERSLLELRLAPDGQTLEWLDADGRNVARGPAEPGLDAWQQLRLKLLLWLVPEALL